jgi:hypothetical protein
VTAPLAPFTAAQESRLAAIEAAPYDEASAVERAARAMWEAASRQADPVWPNVGIILRDHYRRLAVAALAAMKGQDDAAQAVARVEALAEPGNPDLRMHAYYYGFEATGVGIVDEILSAVAQAGKSYHNTVSWADEDEWTKPSHEQRIQQAADNAADRIRAAIAGAEVTR